MPQHNDAKTETIYIGTHTRAILAPDRVFLQEAARPGATHNWNTTAVLKPQEAQNLSDLLSGWEPSPHAGVVE